MKLDDVGKEIRVTFTDVHEKPGNKVIQMVIKAPRGTLTLWEIKPYLRGKYWHTNQNSLRLQCRAIKSFMKEHIND